MPNLLTRALPLFARSAARGHRKYLASLQQRGLIRPRQGGWEVVPPPHREDPHTLAATQATTQRT
ncbi:short-chain dehydrogenase [Xanthomonas oryzae pv. oryzae]|uniref:Short-chain dehydrogenase n=3 Tax=Xanthomonas oryzae TaxID=347 RepID=A0A854CLW6_XANOO|nr:short chain dehydrogenase [Xanthomonas oryzae pv. oryzae PXO99A]AEQ96583.1 short chain dehydrogenase [Xanthomonas oryzae pv. oryzicola BLS256]AJQ82632.1 short-chain dehydrogenase [Xanthomonas oryzae pv. oryzae PXO86]AKK64132.1 short-chain dehydrogenase [Xanthomonas oryzae pv. oryzicola]ALZ71418.1 short-chain dehydrogenase [Xanthomonas oryzae pv. oryzae]KOR41687.1 short-chain dehydrogenase [Xanthomonas oryzae]